jgi:hypothetical protein
MSAAMLEGAGILAAGIAAGRLWLRLARRPSAPAPHQPVCGCGHHRSFHDPEAGRCHSTMKVRSTFAQDGWIQDCTCRAYTGPEPLPEFYAPEIDG